MISDDEMPSLVDVSPFSEKKRFASLNSEATETTSQMSCTSFGTEGAPKKPQRMRSGKLSEFIVKSVGQPVKGDQSVTLSQVFDEESETEPCTEEKWGALNDSKPRNARRRVRRIVRSYSDSELSEASTIDSSSEHNKKARREQIRMRNIERQAKHEKRKQKKLSEYLPTQVPEEPEPEEDDDLVDTDKDLPYSEDGQRQLRLLRRKEQDKEHKTAVKEKLKRSSRSRSDEGRRSRSSEKRLESSSNHLDSPSKGARRGGRKDEILSSLSPRAIRKVQPLGTDGEPRRANSLNGARRSKRNVFDAPSKLPDFGSEYPKLRGEGGSGDRRSSSKEKKRSSRKDAGHHSWEHGDSHSSLQHSSQVRPEYRRSSSGRRRRHPKGSLSTSRHKCDQESDESSNSLQFEGLSSKALQAYERRVGSTPQKTRSTKRKEKQSSLDSSLDAMPRIPHRHSPSHKQ